MIDPNDILARQEQLSQERIEERRLRFYPVRPRDVLAAFGPACECISIPVDAHLAPLPDGYKVKAVHHDYSRDCLMFLVHHPSFESVPGGQQIPCNGDMVAFEYMVLRHWSDGSYRPEAEK